MRLAAHLEGRFGAVAWRSDVLDTSRGPRVRVCVCVYVSCVCSQVRGDRPRLGGTAPSRCGSTLVCV